MTFPTRAPTSVPGRSGFAATSFNGPRPAVEKCGPVADAASYRLPPTGTYPWHRPKTAWDFMNPIGGLRGSSLAFKWHRFRADTVGMHPNRAHAPAVCATDPFAACHAQEQGRSVFGSWPESPTDAGFTLIELMVVLLILAILLAIAIPTFLGVTGGANDKAAQSNLNTALTTAKTAETQANQSYSTVTAASLQSNEPSLSFVTGGTTTQGQISVYVSTDGNGIVLASPSKNNSRCWYVVDNIAAVGVTSNGPYVTAGSTNGSATSAPTVAGTFYGKSVQSSCNASGPLPTGTGNTPTWA